MPANQPPRLGSSDSRVAAIEMHAILVGPASPAEAWELGAFRDPAAEEDCLTLCCIDLRTGTMQHAADCDCPSG